MGVCALEGSVRIASIPFDRDFIYRAAQAFSLDTIPTVPDDFIRDVATGRVLYLILEYGMMPTCGVALHIEDDIAEVGMFYREGRPNCLRRDLKALFHSIMILLWQAQVKRVYVRIASQNPSAKRLIRLYRRMFGLQLDQYVMTTTMCELEERL